MSYNVAESTTPPGTPPQRHSGISSTTTKVSKQSDSLISPSKRRYVANMHDMEVVKKIKLNEIELQDRNTVLRGIKSNVRYFSRVSFLLNCIDY
jgi:parafibromin